MSDQRDDVHVEQHGDGDVKVEQPTPEQDAPETPQEGGGGEEGGEE